MSLLDDLLALATHLSPADVGSSDPVLAALLKVLEHEGLEVPAASELLPEDHPSQISPPAPAAPAAQPDVGGLLARLEAALARLEGHSASTSEPGPAQAGSESSAPSSEPATAPEYDR
jgi:hypothetical protein